MALATKDFEDSREGNPTPKSCLGPLFLSTERAVFCYLAKAARGRFFYWKIKKCLWQLLLFEKSCLRQVLLLEKSGKSCLKQLLLGRQLLLCGKSCLKQLMPNCCWKKAALTKPLRQLFSKSKSCLRQIFSNRKTCLRQLLPNRRSCLGQLFSNRKSCLLIRALVCLGLRIRELMIALVHFFAEVRAVRACPEGPRSFGQASGSVSAMVFSFCLSGPHAEKTGQRPKSVQNLTLLAQKCLTLLTFSSLRLFWSATRTLWSCPNW